LEEAAKYIKCVRGPEDCGFLVCQAQIRLIKSLLGEECSVRDESGSLSEPVEA